jgi:hypothetical protein
MKNDKNKSNSSVVDPQHSDADPNSTYHPDAYLGSNPESDFYLMRIWIFI